MRALLAEFAGTFWIVLGGCGSMLIASGGNGQVGVAFAFGFSVMAAVYAFGSWSGGHFNPAVSIAFAFAGRFDRRQLPAYLAAQVLGAVAGAGVLYLVMSGQPGFDQGDGMASNGYDARSPGGYPMMAAFFGELISTFVFAMVILRVSDGSIPPGLAGAIIGLTLTGIILATGPISNASLNPARSTGPALFAGGEFLQQLWLFWVAPIAGGALSGLIHRLVRTDA